MDGQIFVNFYHGFKNTFVLQKIISYGRNIYSRINPEGAPQKGMVDFKKLEKGCLCYLEDERYPMRGHLLDTQVAQAVSFKRAIPLAVRFIMGKGEFTNGSWLKKALKLLSIRLNYPLYIQFVHFALAENFLDVDRYSQPIRELYRVFPQEWAKERDIICFILEYDMAYRYRFQDIVSLLDKEAFRKNPLKEINRLFEIMISREVVPGVTKEERDFMLDKKWIFMQKIANIYLKVFGKNLVKKLRAIVEDINLDEIKSSPEDKYWQAGYKDYNFRGLTYEIRQKLKMTE